MWVVWMDRLGWMPLVIIGRRHPMSTLGTINGFDGLNNIQSELNSLYQNVIKREKRMDELINGKMYQ